MTGTNNASLLPEVNSYAPLTIRTGNEEIPGSCKRISLKTITASTDKMPEAGIVANVVINTRDFNKELSLKVKVNDVQSQNDGEHFVLLDIIDASRENEKKLSYFYISSIWNEVTSRIPDENAVFAPRNLVGLFEKEDVLRTLKEMLSDKYSLFLVRLDPSEVVKAKFLDQTDEELIFATSDAPRSFFKKINHDPLYIYWPHGFRQHLFVSYFKEHSDGRLILVHPVLLLSSSLREEERTQVEPGTMWVEIPVPYPKGAFIKREIIDISSGGFAFKCPIDSAYFLPGTPISSLRILGKDREPFVSAGQIRHVTPVTKNTNQPYLKIGVQLQISNKAFAKGHAHPEVAKRQRKLPITNKESKNKTGIFKTFKHILKTGLRTQAGQETTVGTKSTTGTTSFKCMNKKNQEIVGFVDTTWKGTDRRRATVIVLPPPYGKRKEALGLFTHYLIERFKNQFRDAAVVRYDSTNHIGESYKDPQCREPWQECLHMTLSQGTEDLLSILDFVENNDFFLAKEIILISFSIGALVARKAIVKDQRRRVHFWIAPMGATHMGDLLIRVSGGIDYFDLYERGQTLGDVTILGITVQGDRFCEDALSKGYVTVEDAIQDMSKINIPVMWLYGAYDSWIDPENVEKLLAAKTEGWKKIKVIPTGHLPLNGEEAIGVFETIFDEMWPLISEDEIVPFIPNLTELIEKQEHEWKRNPRDLRLSRKKYWTSYLLGQEESDIGYDILQYCEEYVEFLREQIRLLDIRENHKVADMGCGTGNLVLQFLEDYKGNDESFPTFALVDLIEEALLRAKEKCTSVALKKGISPESFKVHKADLDIHPALPVKKFLLGEFCSIDDLRGQIPNLTSYTINLWKNNFSRRLYYILRGKKITPRDIEYLDKGFPEEEKKLILEFNQVSRIIKQIIAPLCPFVSYELNTPSPKEKNNNYILGIDLSNVVFRLPFDSNIYDRIISSLVLSYMKNPMDTLAEFYRCLKPGGIMVISSMKPDTDMSSIFTKMIDRLNKGLIPIPPDDKEKYLKATRDFANSAAQLFQLVDERKFRFFHLDELQEMMEEVGLKVIDTSESYGDPPQAFIIKALKKM